MIEPSRWSALELQLLARTSFSCEDYYNDIVMKGAMAPADASTTPGFVIVAATSVLLAAFVVPQLPIGTTWKNILGLVMLSGPLLSVGLELLAPGLAASIISAVGRSAASPPTSPASSSSSPLGSISQERERVAYHEAGHFLAGYLCGVPILEYSLPEDGGGISRESLVNTFDKHYPIALYIASGVTMLYYHNQVVTVVDYPHSRGMRAPRCWPVCLRWPRY